MLGSAKMVFEVNDSTTLRSFYLKDAPELKVIVPDPITSGGMTLLVHHSNTSNLYQYYRSIFDNVGKFEDVTFTPVEEVPHGAKVYRYQA